MKFVVVLALFALAVAEPEAEADPWLYYNHAGYHPYAYNYGNYYGGLGYGYPYAYNYPYAHALPKAAEVKVEEAPEVKKVEVAKPVAYTLPYYYGHNYGYQAYHPYTYAGLQYPRYYANSAGVVHAVAKREAESDSNPESWYGTYGYPGHYGYHGYRGYSGYHYPYTYGAYNRGYYYGK